jgi:hypothetical protein
MSPQIDYRSIDIPADESPDEYHYTARRAEILQLIEKAGHPSMVNGADLARRYGCSRQNIYNDLDALAESIDDVLGERRVLTTHTVISKCITGLLEEGEYRKAARTQLDFNEWIDDYRDREEFEARLDQLEEHLSQQGPATTRGPSITADGGVDVDTTRETDTDST